MTSILDIIPVPCDLHHFVLNVLGQPFLQGLGNHGDLVPVNHIIWQSITASGRRSARGMTDSDCTNSTPETNTYIVIITSKLTFTQVVLMPSYRKILVNTNFLFGVSAKHLRDDVSTTVSQKVTTGSAT